MWWIIITETYAEIENGLPNCVFVVIQCCSRDISWPGSRKFFLDFNHTMEPLRWRSDKNSFLDD